MTTLKLVPTDEDAVDPVIRQAHDGASGQEAIPESEAPPGEIVAEHDRGGPVDNVYLVTAGDSDMVKLEFANRRDGQLSVKLPLGGELVLPNPRRHR